MRFGMMERWNVGIMGKRRLRINFKSYSERGEKFPPAL